VIHFCDTDPRKAYNLEFLISAKGADMCARLTLLILVALTSVSAQQANQSPSSGRLPAGGAQTAVSPAVGGAPPGVPAPSAADRTTIAAVMAFEKACDDAAVKGDTAFLKRALSRDFIMTHGDGWTTGNLPLKVDTKDSWIEYVGKQPPPYFYRNLDSVQVELHGDIAITVGRYRYLPRPANSNAAPQSGHMYVWFERLYAKRNGEWQFLSHRTVDGPNREADTVASK